MPIEQDGPLQGNRSTKRSAGLDRPERTPLIGHKSQMMVSEDGAADAVGLSLQFREICAGQ